MFVNINYARALIFEIRTFHVLCLNITIMLMKCANENHHEIKFREVKLLSSWFEPKRQRNNEFEVRSFSSRNSALLVNQGRCESYVPKLISGRCLVEEKSTSLANEPLIYDNDEWAYNNWAMLSNQIIMLRYHCWSVAMNNFFFFKAGNGRIR